MKYCPNCGAPIEEGHKFCANCGTAKPEAAAAWTCPSCGAEGNIGKFCGNCGKPRP